MRQFTWRPACLLAPLLTLVSCRAPDRAQGPDLSLAIGTPVIESLPELRFGIPDSIGGASQEMGRAVSISTGYAVGDWDGKRILIFDSVGVLTRIIGRPGAGPGEFRAPTIVHSYAGDSLLIWDPYLRRVSRLSARTGKSHDLSLHAEAGYGSAPLVGRLEDGRLVVRHEVFGPSAEQQGTQVSTVLRLVDARGTIRSTVTTFPPVPHGDNQGFRFFAPRVQVATDGHRILAGYSDRWEIGVWDADGNSRSLLTRPWTQRAVKPDDKARIRAAITSPDMAPGFMDDDRFDATVPAYGAILPGPQGTIWVLDYTPPYLSPDSVSVFDRRGMLLGVVALPEGFRPSEVTVGGLLGTGSDSNGDFEVRRYRVGRSATQ